MSQIEKIYDNWIEEQPYSNELEKACDKISKVVEGLVGSSEIGMLNEIYCMLIDCISIGQHEAFLAGFKTDAALWREC